DPRVVEHAKKTVDTWMQAVGDYPSMRHTLLQSEYQTPYSINEFVVDMAREELDIDMREFFDKKGMIIPGAAENGIIDDDNPRYRFLQWWWQRGHGTALLNKDICPVIPEQGSVGASGDLAPLAHLSLVLLGMGEAFYNGERIPGKEALKRAGIAPVELEAAEGLALINGTQVMTAVGGLAAHDALELSKITDIAAAMSLEVLMGSRTEFDPRIHQVRPHPGQGAAADNMLRLVQNSEIITSHKDCRRIQDAYTLRCSPQVHGASRDAVDYTAGVLETEMNSSTNNPLIFAESEEFLLGGNFHGQPVALALDFLCMALSELANISERRVERLVNPMLSGLPAFLVSDGGLNSGFMIAQYTAAALVSENKTLCHPASVDSIPTSANKEDHVSMGTISARKARKVVENTQNVVAIELLCAAQAMDLFTNLKPGEGSLAAYRTIRDSVTHLDEDRILSTDIEAVSGLIREGRLVQAVEEAVGPLK
ncbi:MAG: histidine ammonia-lyase, partial [Thermodesulfobacteriota bacterium]